MLDTPSHECAHVDDGVCVACAQPFGPGTFGFDKRLVQSWRNGKRPAEHGWVKALKRAYKTLAQQGAGETSTMTFN